MGNKWVFRIKQNLDDSIAWYKARLVAKSFHQQSGIEFHGTERGLDFHETFSPVINPITVHTMLSIVLNCKWGIRQHDVNNV